MGPNEIPGVGLHAYCADPEGNLFGILQPAPASRPDQKS
jgi:predicted enzyme related to lactoylglutathione lyase